HNHNVHTYKMYQLAEQLNYDDAIRAASRNG
ncbi:MAG: hypothetical protein ACI8RD_005505, partial [Bacillariaceae sp.]